MVETRFAPPLVGRSRHLDRMREWVADLAAGRGRAVLVEGEPGIGKTFLVHAAVAEAKAANCQVFWAACDELSQAFPLLPLLDAIDSAPLGAAQREIAELLRADDAPGNRVDLIAAATERLLSVVDEACAKTPVLLVVDDLQWADPATVQVLGRLARAVRQHSLLLVGATRSVPRRDDLRALRRAIEPAGLLRLHSLSDAEVIEFVAAKVNGTPGRRLLRLAAGASGNPLYLSELVDALVRGGAIAADAQGDMEVTGGQTPGSLAAAIAHRLEFLPASVRGALRAAALLGVGFSVSDLAAVSGRSVADLLPVLDEAILAGVLRGDGPELAFRHPLIRTALYDEMPAAVRAAWHRDAGRALAEGGAAPDRVARQLLPALDVHHGSEPADDWVVRWLADVGQHLVGRAPQAAISLLRWALAAAPGGAVPYDLLTCRLADALYRAGDVTGAARVATQALAHVVRPDLVVDLHWTLAQCRAMEGRSEESLAALKRGLDAPGIGPRHRTRLLVLTARTYCMLGRVDAAGQAAEAAVAAATAAGDRWATGWALSVLTVVHGMRGEPVRALPLFDQALAVAEGAPGLADLRLVLQVNQAVAFGNLDQMGAAIKAAEQVRQLADETGNVVRLGQAQTVLGELLFNVGRWDDALAEVDLESAVPKEPTAECLDQSIGAAIGLHRGDAAAVRYLAEAERSAERLGDRVIAQLALAKSLEREQAAAPKEALAVLMDNLSETEEGEETADLLADAVRLALMVGDEAAARAVVAQAEAVASASDVPHRLAVAPHCRGLLDGDPTSLVLAAKHYEAAGRPLPRAQALEAAGAALAERGDIAAARTHFTTAFAIYSDLNAEWDLARTQAKFRAYGIRRGPHVRHRRSDHGWSSLTPTEVKVAALVAEGLSNPQIAAHLFLSRRTVQTHVSHILAKLNLHSRTEIAREASRREAG